MSGRIDISGMLPASPEARKRREQLQEGELTCKVTEAAARRAAEGTAPRIETLEDKIRQMDELGVDKALCGTWKMFSYHNKRFLWDVSIDDVAAAVNKYPKRLFGLTGYNPFRIQQSLQDIKRAVRDYNFKGVNLHIYGFDLYFTDARMYPLYALCEELQIPVMMQVGHVLEAMPSKYGRPMQLDEIELHFPGLKVIGLHTGYPWSDELISCCVKWDNIYFGLTSWEPRYLPPSVVSFINGQGREKCLKGGISKRLLEQIDQLGLREDAKENLLGKTAAKVFNLDAT